MLLKSSFQKQRRPQSKHGSLRAQVSKKIEVENDFHFSNQNKSPQFWKNLRENLRKITKRNKKRNKKKKETIVLTCSYADDCAFLAPRMCRRSWQRGMTGMGGLRRIWCGDDGSGRMLCFIVILDGNLKWRIIGYGGEERRSCNCGICNNIVDADWRKRW